MARAGQKLALVLLGILIIANYSNLFAAETEDAVAEDGKKAVLTAEEITFDYESQLILARGNVLLKYNTTIVRAEQLRINAETNTVESQGETELEQEDYVITGVNLFYDLHTEKGNLFNFYSQRVSETGEPMLFSGEEMFINGEVLTYQESFFTGCDRENPHYHFTAKKVEYYPGDRMVFYHVKCFEGVFHIFSWPKLVVSLQEKDNNFSETVFGYNQVDGWFLKVVYRYYLESGGDGRLLLDLIERRGHGKGILHSFELDRGRELSLSFYHFADKVTLGDDYQFGVNWRHNLNPLYSYSLQYEYWLKTIDYGGGYYWWNEEYSLLANCVGRDQVFPFTATVDTGVYGVDPIFYAKPKLNLRWRPSSQTSMTYSGFLDYRYPLAADEKIIDRKYRYTLSLAHNWLVEGEPFRFRAELYEAMDLSSQANPYWRDWNRCPYLSLDTPEFNMGFLGDYRVRLDYLHLVEVPSLIQGQRSEFILTRKDQPIFAMGNFSLNLVGSVRKQKYWVEEGEYSRQALTFGLEGVERFTPILTWRNRLTWTQADGAAPTGFYQLVNNTSYYMPYGNYRSGLYLQTNQLRANLEGGYNLNTKVNPWHLVTTSVNWRVNQENRVDFNTSYNPNTREYGNVNLVARYQPDNENYLRLDLVYSPRDKIWSTLDLESRLRRHLFWNLQAEANVLYSFFGDGLERCRWGLIYDWHCREVYFGYDTILQEYALQLQYKVFPDAGFGLGTSEPGFSFGGGN